MEPEVVAAGIVKKRIFKKFSFRGVDLDALLDMSTEDLVKHFSSRIRRRFSRGFTRKPMALIKKLRKATQKKKHIKTKLRESIHIWRKKKRMQQPYEYRYPQGTGPSAPPPPPKAGVIVDPKYCSLHPVDLAIVRKVLKITDGNFVITNAEGNLLFKVKDPFFSLHEKRILMDGFGTKVLTLKGKIMTMHDRWLVFRGGSTEEVDLLYTVKRSNMVQITTKLDVFLADNIEQKKCDYRLEGVWLETSCFVYAGDSDIILAQMREKKTMQSVLFGKDNFCLTVNPNVDYAFIASLIVILVEIQISLRKLTKQLLLLE